ncbi:hypothetical protein GCM10009839_07020 [Catenulispora yoronensis]|uniref:Hsp70 family protein n=1 Tax=Catenulispora yoronensis TaxID=450799 RepID=A0ABP5F479_9ACTN
MTSKPRTRTPSEPSYPRRDTVLVVDFGTSLTTATLLSGGVAKPVGDPVAGARSWPSSAHLGADGLTVGDLAEGYRSSTPLAFVAEFKRYLGSAEPIPHWGLDLTAAQVTSALLAAIRAEAQGKVHEPVDRLLITCPGDFKIGVPADRRWADLDAACRAAGFLDVEYLPEPVAAAYAPVAEGALPDDALVLVYDLGGGTFDAALVRIGPRRHDVLAATSIPFCGGADIDALLMEELRDVTGIGPDSGNGRVDALLKTTARDVKQRLSLTREDTVSVLPTLDDVVITRARLEELVTEWGKIKQTVEAAVGLCADAGINTLTDLEAILAVGGSSRIPLVEQHLSHLGRPIRRPIDIGTAVADGAVEWARRGTDRVLDVEQTLPTHIPLRWPLPPGRVTVSTWLAGPGDRLRKGDPILRVAVPGGALWDLRADRPGTLEAQHYREAAVVTAQDWLATMRPLRPGEDSENGASIMPRLWRTIAGTAVVAAVSGDERYVARADGKTVRLYDLEEWAVVGSATVGAPVVQIVFDRRGGLLIVTDTGVHGWDPEQGAAPKLIVKRDHPRVAVRPDGEVVAVSSRTEAQVVFLRGDSMEKIGESKSALGYSNVCQASLFSADGKTLIPASRQDNLTRQEPDTDGLPAVLWHTYATTAAFDGTGRFALFGDDAGQITMRSVETGQRTSVLSSVGAGVAAIACSPDSPVAAVGLRDGYVELRRVDDGVITLQPLVRRRVGVCGFLQFIDHGSMLVTGTAGSLSLWSLTDLVPAPARR